MREFRWGRAGLAIACLVGTLFVMGCPPPGGGVRAIAVGSVANGTLPVPHARHRYSINIPYPQTVTIYVNGHGLDPTVRVVRAGGPQVGYNDDGGAGLDSRLVLTLAPGSYIIEVAGYGASTGGYTLTIQ